MFDDLHGSLGQDQQGCHVIKGLALDKASINGLCLRPKDLVNEIADLLLLDPLGFGLGDGLEGDLVDANQVLCPGRQLLIINSFWNIAF